MGIDSAVAPPQFVRVDGIRHRSTANGAKHRRQTDSRPTWHASKALIPWLSPAAGGVAVRSWPPESAPVQEATLVFVAVIAASASFRFAYLLQSRADRFGFSEHSGREWADVLNRQFHTTENNITGNTPRTMVTRGLSDSITAKARKVNNDSRPSGRPNPMPVTSMNSSSPGRLPRSIRCGARLRLTTFATLGLSLVALTASAAPSRTADDDATPEVKAKVSSYISEIQEAEADLTVNLARSKLIRTKQPVSRMSIVNPDIIDVVQFGPQEFEVIGRHTGTTTMTLWFGGAREQLPVIRYQVTVVRDPAEADDRRVQYHDLQKMINELYPNSMIYIIPVADKVIVKGEARDAEEAAQIMSIVQNRGTNYAGSGSSIGGGGFVGPSGGLAALPHPDDVTLPQSTVVNLLNVPGEHQVMLKVRIAELSRTSLRQMGIDISARIGDNSFLTSVLSGSPNVVAILDNSDVSLMLRAFSSNGMSKILAEPNLVTLSGRTASFIAGGEFAVPTVVGVGGAQAATTQFRGFGTQLTFTPTVIDKDRIRLQVSPEFSAINSRNSVNGIPGLDTRAADTTVDLREGQWLAIAGLLQNEQTGTNGRIPLVGDIPLIRTFFSNKTVSRGETELIVLVSPELVHPIEPEDFPCLLPGMEITEPTDWQFYIQGHLEGDPECHHRSTVWPQYADQIHMVHKGRVATENFYVSGPHGFSD